MSFTLGQDNDKAQNIWFWNRSSMSGLSQI
jgi:hypothetical protein